MIQKFLSAKHWQLFVLTFGIPMALQFILIAIAIFGLMFHLNPDHNFMFTYFNVYPLVMFLFVGILMGWFWSIGIGLQTFIPQELRLKIAFFKVTLLFPVIYILFFLGFMISMSELRPSLWMLIPIIPMHLFSMFCMIYNLYFVAKTFKTAELQREVHFSDYAGEFFLIWFYPVGIWIIQPKINKMLENKLQETSF